MKLSAFAESIALKINKEEDLGFIESLKFDILGYRSSIIADTESSRINRNYIQTLEGLQIDKGDDDTEFISLPPLSSLIAFKDNNSSYIKAYNRVGRNIANIPIITVDELYTLSSRKFNSKSNVLIREGNNLIASNFKLSCLQGFRIEGSFGNLLEVAEYTNNTKCKLTASCYKDDEIVIEDSLFQKITIFVYKQLNLPENENLIVNATQ